MRANYRCTMCHKGCWIPCQMTASQFEELVHQAGEASDMVPNESESLTLAPGR